MRIKAEKGFSMIEILVALVILAIGLLGMATLMMNSLQTNQSAAWRSAATLAAYDLAERMRSNVDEEVLKNAKYAVEPLKKAADLAAGAPAEAEKRICSGTPTELAACDLKMWAYDLNQAIPGSRALVKSETVQVEGESQNRLWCIAIFWEDTGGKDVTEAGTVCSGSKANEINGKPWAFYEVRVLL